MATQEYEIKQGKTFVMAIRFEELPFLYLPITGISLSAGAPRLTVTGHGLPNGWRASIVNVVGMTQLNALRHPPTDEDFTPIRVVDANTIELNQIDATGFDAYVSGGFVRCYSPVSLTGATVRAAIRERNGTTFYASTSDGTIDATADDTAKLVTLVIGDVVTAAFDWATAVFDVEIVLATGEVHELASGVLRLKREVTTQGV